MHSDDGVEPIPEGTHERVVINAARFKARLVGKQPRSRP
jgi:predicted thioesterase